MYKYVSVDASSAVIFLKLASRPWQSEISSGQWITHPLLCQHKKGFILSIIAALYGKAKVEGNIKSDLFLLHFSALENVSI